LEDNKVWQTTIIFALKMATPSFSYPPANRCIYCGETGNLSDEHILPHSLNGKWVLPNASCGACANITSQLEGIVTRVIYLPFRAKRNFQTRHPKKRPKTFPLYVSDNQGNETFLEVPVADYPNVYLSVEAPEPGLFLGEQPSDRNPELKVNVRGDPAEVNAALETLGVEKTTFSFQFEYGAYFRQIAKIGHAFAYGSTGGIGYKPLLTDVIRGLSPYVSYYVGGMGAELTGEAATMGLSLAVIERNSVEYLVATVHLLGVGAIPPYQAIVGEIFDLDSLISSQLERREFRRKITREFVSAEDISGEPGSAGVG
jgi:hypothetical protein